MTFLGNLVDFQTKISISITERAEKESLFFSTRRSSGLMSGGAGGSHDISHITHQDLHRVVSPLRPRDKYRKSHIGLA